MIGPLPNAGSAFVRAIVLGGFLAVFAGPFGFALGLVALPLGVLEGHVRKREAKGWELCGWTALAWGAALVGCALAYSQGVYAQAAYAHGPKGGVSALLKEFEAFRTAEAQTLRLFLVCGALGFSGAFLCRLTSRLKPYLFLGLLSGVIATWISPLADHGSWLDAGVATLFMTPCLLAGAIPLWLGLTCLYLGVDHQVARWQSEPSST